MSSTLQVLDEMRAAVEAMSPKSGVRSSLEKWHARLSEALQSDVRATQSAPAPRSDSPRYDVSVHGIFDVQSTQERQTWAEGRLQHVYTRAQVEKNSRKPWGNYPDLQP
jgi:hypothetical protein